MIGVIIQVAAQLGCVAVLVTYLGLLFLVWKLFRSEMGEAVEDQCMNPQTLHVSEPPVSPSVQV